jgi:5-formyltetrahydrofolate cyclo-ligase
MKQKLRKQIKELRDSLSESEIKEKSAIIIKKLESLKEFKQAKTICFYVSYDNEVFTHDIIKKYLDKKTIVVPKVNGDNLLLCKIDSFDQLEKGYCNILEPKDNDRYDGDIDVIIVPGIAFDKNLHRVGYGKGFYDDFLKGSDAKKIGLCFDLQVVDKIPRDEWDERLDMVITEKDIIKP